MINLIIKDLLIQKKMLLLSAFYIILMIVTLQNSQEAMFSVGIVMLSYVLSQTACAYDDKNKTDIMLNSLPIKRNNIVLARYLSVFVYALFGTLIYYVMYLLLNSFMLPIKVFPITIPGLIGTLLALSLINGLYYPIFFKLGYTKGKFFNMIIFFMVFFGIGGIITVIASKSSSNVFVNVIISSIENQSNLQIGIMIFAISLILLSVSYAFSIHFYNKRDF